MRDVLEAIVTHAAGVDRSTLDEIHAPYTKLFWINTGPYNNLTSRKFVLACTPAAFAAAARAAAQAGARFPLRHGETLDALLARLQPMFFDPDLDPIVTSKTPRAGKDIVTASANNLYADVTMADLEGFEEERPGLNSRLARKRDGRAGRGGLPGRRPRYGTPIAAIVEHLEAALPFATEPMAKALRALVAFYRTGEEADREAYDIAWVQDKASPVDTINGFVEVYLDARSIKGAWEAIVFAYVNHEKTTQIQTHRGTQAQWFEDHMPWEASLPQGRRPRRHRQRDRRGHRDGGVGSDHAGRDQPAQRPGDPRAGAAASRYRCPT